MQVRGLSTGEGLRTRDPVLYRMVVRLLGQDAPVREIKRLTGLHHRTIMAVREREGETIDTLRKSLGARALRTAALAIERMEDQIVSGSAKLGELAMAAGILVDKGQVLTGGVTSRTERVEAEIVEDKLRDLLQSIPAADARVVVDTGIGAGELSAMAGLGDGADLPSEDLQSFGSQCPDSHDTGFDTDSGSGAGDGAGDLTRGGGGSASDGGVSLG